MKKIFIFLIPLFAILFGCNENDRMVWNSKSGIYFPDFNKNSDSLMYSLRISNNDLDTVWIKVKLQGALLASPKEFKVSVGENSSAEQNVHYLPIAKSYIFPEEKDECLFPIVVMNKNHDLDNRIVTIELNLEENDDFAQAYPQQCSMRLMITNQLVKPSYWNGDFTFYFGKYSQAKHIKCIEIMGHDFPINEEELSGYAGLFKMTYWQRIGHKVCNYYLTHEEYDENGEYIEPWEVF